MGLSDAIRTRLALSRGESLGEKLRIFLASKEERRRIAARKFPGRAVPTGAARRSVGPVVPDDVLAELLDAGWYAEANGLTSDAAGHFRDRGLAAGLAPRAALAGPDGRRLSPRGAELLHRLGVPLGAAPCEGEPGGRDPWTFGNPEGKGLAVVTAIASAGERLLPVPPEWTERADFFVVSDLAFAEPGAWQPVRQVYHHPDRARVVAFSRTHLPTFFSAYSRILWIDPGVLCCTNPAELPSGSGSIATFRRDDITPGGEAAAVAATSGAAAELVAELLGAAAAHPGFDRAGLLDASVLLIDPSDAAVRRLMARWWRHLPRGPVAADALALTLAAADLPDLAVGELPGRTLVRSPAFAAGGAV
jgi:hypothetical protein